MGFLDKFSKSLGKSAAADEGDVDSYLDTLGVENDDLLDETADIWVKPMVLEDLIDATSVTKELSTGNVIILNIEPLYKRNSVKMKQAIAEIKSNIKKINGDMVRLTEYRLLITPKGMKVAKGKA